MSRAAREAGDCPLARPMRAAADEWCQAGIATPNRPCRMSRAAREAGDCPLAQPMRAAADEESQARIATLTGLAVTAEPRGRRAIARSPNRCGRLPMRGTGPGSQPRPGLAGNEPNAAASARRGLASGGADQQLSSPCRSWRGLSCGPARRRALSFGRAARAGTRSSEPNAAASGRRGLASDAADRQLAGLAGPGAGCRVGPRGGVPSRSGAPQGPTLQERAKPRIGGGPGVVEGWWGGGRRMGVSRARRRRKGETRVFLLGSM